MYINLQIGFLAKHDLLLISQIAKISAIGSVQQLDNNSMSLNCLFLNNQSFYCVVCCSTDPSVPPDSSVYNISTTRGTEVTVDLDGLTSDQMYYCKAAATNTNSASCGGPVVGDVKVYFHLSVHLLLTSIGKGGLE